MTCRSEIGAEDGVECIDLLEYFLPDIVGRIGRINCFNLEFLLSLLECAFCWLEFKKNRLSETQPQTFFRALSQRNYSVEKALHLVIDCREWGG